MATTRSKSSSGYSVSGLTGPPIQALFTNTWSAPTLIGPTACRTDSMAPASETSAAKPISAEILCCRVSAVDVDHGELCTFIDQPGGYAVPDPGRGPGDHNDLPSEPVH